MTFNGGSRACLYVTFIVNASLPVKTDELFSGFKFSQLEMSGCFPTAIVCNKHP